MDLLLPPAAGLVLRPGESYPLSPLAHLGSE
jgi:hypothetical protein